MKDFIRDQLRTTITTLLAVGRDDALLDRLAEAARITAEALLRGNKLMIAGNGGSAAEAQHLAAEFVGRFTKERPALAAIALTTDTSCLTCIGNDYGFERIFDRQIEALGQAGDVFLALSTSGNSPNLLLALERCRQMKISTLGFCGARGGKMVGFCDQAIQIPSLATTQIQEGHLTLGHVFCGLVEQRFLRGEQ